VFEAPGAAELETTTQLGFADGGARRRAVRLGETDQGG